MTDLVTNSIIKLESVMKKMPQVDVAVRHHFLPGIYVREMLLPAGVSITGKTHKKDHIMIIASGKVAVVSNELEEILVAPTILHSRAGTKRAAHALEDTVWLTIHSTNKTTLAEIEAELIGE